MIGFAADEPLPSETAAGVKAMKQHFSSGATIPLASRLAALKSLEHLVIRHEDRLLEALMEDLGKPRAEGWLSELALVRHAIRDLEKRLPSFVRRSSAKVPLVQRPGRASVQWEPLGCCLVISAWNYPVQLLLIPVATAIAAGNVVVAKPSELAPATSSALASIFAADLDPNLVRIAQGGADLTLDLIENRLDHIFFTGSSTTARLIMAAAAKHLTPVTLELGGKSPAYVHSDADLDVAARRIVFAKFLNAGQTCVAPDYVLAHDSVVEELTSRVQTMLERFFGPDPAMSPDFGRIVNERHFLRLVALLDGAHGDAVVTGTNDVTRRYFAPTVIRDPDPTSALMNEEIFGPILPIISVPNTEAAIREISSRPAPLAIYCFSRSNKTSDEMARRTRSGAVVQNTAAEQFALMSLPFGGVGESGMGAYHAGAGLERFSHQRSYLRRGTRLETSLAYPPSSKRKLSLLRRALRA